MTRSSPLPFREIPPRPEIDDEEESDSYQIVPNPPPSLPPRPQQQDQPNQQGAQGAAGGPKVPLAANRTYDDFKPKNFAKPFCTFLTKNPTVFHAVDAFSRHLTCHGFTKLSARDSWKLEKGGKYFLDRNGSSLIAFTVGKDYEPGNGVAMIAGHIDALTVKLKPVSVKPTRQGFVQLGVAPYAGALNTTWWDRDLGIAGRVLVKDSSGTITTKLVNLNEPIARIPTLAHHFGLGFTGEGNTETQMVPIIALDNSDISGEQKDKNQTQKPLGDVGTFAATQPPQLVKAIAGKLGVQNYNEIINWELELYDVQGANLGGLNREFIYGGRIDDKLCSWSAIQALLGCSYDSSEAASSSSSKSPSIIKCVALFDNEEIGSLTRQGAHSNLLPLTIERILDSFSPKAGANLLAQTYANSYLISADVTHAVNPNFESVYLENHKPRLNVGVAVSGDSNGNVTTDAVSGAFLQQVADKSKSKLQVFQIRNDSRSGGTVGPMLSSAMGVRSCDAGLAQLSMHSIRATCGARDPGLGVKLFKGFFEFYEEVDAAFK